MRNEINQFVREIMDERILRHITDLVFLEIENDPRLSAHYGALVSSHDPHTINNEIGRAVKHVWDLSNLGRNHNPRSNLIDSYEEHGWR